MTVNNGSRCGDRVNQTAAQPAIRHVTVTPLSPPNTGQPRITLPNSTPIALRKLLIKDQLAQTAPSLNIHGCGQAISASHAHMITIRPRMRECNNATATF